MERARQILVDLASVPDLLGETPRCNALLAEEGVAIMPGDALGMPGFIRIGYICDDVFTLMEGVRRLVAFGDRLAADLAADLVASR